MIPPVCCGKNAILYQILIGKNSWEIGFKCLNCKRIRIPYGNQEEWDKYQKEVMQPEYERIRKSGILFDKSLDK